MSLIKFFLCKDLKLLEKEVAKEKIIKRGGLVREEVTNDVWFFVTNNLDANSEAHLKAKKLGMVFINENEFLKMLE